MMYSVWNTAVASIRFRHAIGEFIHAFICRIFFPLMEVEPTICIELKDEG